MASQIGHRIVSVSFWVNAHVKEFLEAKGYKVEAYSDRNEAWTQIIW
jgi:hypothetical protein